MFVVALERKALSTIYCKSTPKPFMRR
uniref:Uncharacterized protein n=1 Tax=Arundo donax TaxID=35708 RepID=A0A0A8ZHI2_ARUDO